MTKDYRGTIIEESLEDNRVLNNLEIIKIEITDDENQADRWHIYDVLVSKEDIENLSKFIKLGKWYMHFWKDNKIIAVFRNKRFEFNADDKSTWESVIEFGLSIGIPKEQLDFKIN